MRTVTKNIYSFNELTEEAKAKAIENVRNQEDFGCDFSSWAVDDCGLFEPNNEELSNLFGENYTFPLIENTRGKIYFDTDRNWFLDCDDAMRVTNDEQFLIWLGIPKELVDKVTYRIFTGSGINSNTTIEIEHLEYGEEDFSEQVAKFDDHIQNVLERIQNDIEYRYTDDAIIEDIEANEYEFYENGEIY